MGTSQAKIGNGQPASDVAVGLRVRYTAPGMIYHYGWVAEVVPVSVIAFGAAGRKRVRLADDYRVQFEDGFVEMVTDLRQRCWAVAA